MVSALLCCRGPVSVRRFTSLCRKDRRCLQWWMEDKSTKSIFLCSDRRQFGPLKIAEVLSEEEEEEEERLQLLGRLCRTSPAP